jgi:archaellum component FlaF (FlaF/FlaG flagellin family)
MLGGRNKMSSEFLVPGLIVTVSIIIAVAIFSGAMFSSFSEANSLYAILTRESMTRFETNLKILFAYKVSSNKVKVWIKNLGLTKISPQTVQKSTVLFGPEGKFRIIDYDSSQAPTWSFEVTNDMDGDGFWGPQEVLEVSIEWPEYLGQGDYYVKFTLYGGIEDYYRFTI